MKRSGNGKTAPLDKTLRRLQSKIRLANKKAAKGIEANVRKFSVIAREAERDLKKLRGVGKNSFKAFRKELKRSWAELKKTAHGQF